MSRNVHYGQGDNLPLAVPAGTASGDPVRVGGLAGVALTGRGEGGNASGQASVQLRGVFDVPVEGAVPAVGDPVFMTDAGALVVVASGNLKVGNALATKGSGAGEVPVRFLGSYGPVEGSAA